MMIRGTSRQVASNHERGIDAALVSDGRAESSPATVSITVLGSILRRISMDHIRGMWLWEHRDGAGTSQDSASQSVISDLDPEGDHVLVPVPGEPQ